jgi:SNF2 family DNA or RNA helicase
LLYAHANVFLKPSFTVAQIKQYEKDIPYLVKPENIQEHIDIYNSEQLYDIYIVSLNLLSNENYLNHIFHTASNHLEPYIENQNPSHHTEDSNLFKNKKIINLYKEPKPICRFTDKFNIFKIKWNRVILDEAHEQLAPVIKMFSTSIKNYFKGSTRIHLEDQILFENLCVINSNYKWAMTGTPAEKGIDNIMGILQFLTKKNYSESVFAKIEKIRYMSNIIGISKPNMDSLLSRVFKKTLKKDVKALLNIPIFTEEIIFVEQTKLPQIQLMTIFFIIHYYFKTFFKNESKVQDIKDIKKEEEKILILENKNENEINLKNNSSTEIKFSPKTDLIFSTLADIINEKNSAASGNPKNENFISLPSQSEAEKSAPTESKDEASTKQQSKWFCCSSSWNWCCGTIG